MSMLCKHPPCCRIKNKSPCETKCARLSKTTLNLATTTTFAEPGKAALREPREKAKHHCCATSTSPQELRAGLWIQCQLLLQVYASAGQSPAAPELHQARRKPFLPLRLLNALDLTARSKHTSGPFPDEPSCLRHRRFAT